MPTADDYSCRRYFFILAQANIYLCRRHTFLFCVSKTFLCGFSHIFLLPKATFLSVSIVNNYSATGINSNFSTSNIPLSVIFNEGITGSARNDKVKNGLKSISGEIISMASCSLAKS